MAIVLHVGFHKTGTTSVQASLGAHSAALSGFAHIETLHLSKGLAQATESARAFSRFSGVMGLETGMAAWVKGLPDLGARHLLVSSEDFAGHMPGRFGLLDYRATLRTVPAAVTALRARFSDAKVVVLVTTRAAEPWLKSLHWQLAKHPFLMLKQRRFCKDYAGAADFDAVLAGMPAALAGKAQLSVQPLESLTARRLGPVEALYDLAGLTGPLRDGLAPVPVQNRQVLEGVADQFVRLNRSGLPPDEVRRAKSLMSGIMGALDDGED